jgi:hypothetical protein
MLLKINQAELIAMALSLCSLTNIGHYQQSLSLEKMLACFTGACIIKKFNNFDTQSYAAKKLIIIQICFERMSIEAELG